MPFDLFQVYAGDVLIGSSRLEHGDPPMGVAGGSFSPLPAFANFRTTEAGEPLSPDTLVWRGLTLRSQRYGLVTCEHVAVLGCHVSNHEWEWELECHGFEHPTYEVLFPDHVKAYFG